MTAPDLFSYARYPEQPGYRNRDTSKEAAEAVQGRAVALRALVLQQISASAGLTADEVADRLGESVLAIRPRVTELSKLSRISDSGARRPNRSGRNAIVWQAA